MSQPEPQFFINEFRKNTGVDVTTLQPPQKQQFNPTRWEADQATWYAEDDPRHKWILVQLRKMRTQPIGGMHGEYKYIIPSGVFQQKMREIDDWFEINLQNGTPIDIASYSWDQAVAASDEWHAVSAGRGEGKIYESTNLDLIMFSPQEWEGWSVQKVISENDLLVEGNRMNHCVGDYCRQVQSGSTEIYSLRDPKNEPHVTIEIDPEYNEIIQILGNSNTEPAEEYKVYIRQWFEEFQEKRPGLKLRGEDAFDFDFHYVDNRDIDEEINRIVYQGNEYGLEIPFGELDIETVYDAVIKELESHYRSSDTRYVGNIGPVIANVAWEADKYRAERYGLLGNSQLEESDVEYKAFKTDSNRMGVGWLWYKIEENNMSFLDHFDLHETYTKQEDFATEEEYEKARDEEYYEAERSARSEALPYALDDEIAETLVKLSREDPFLPEHAQFIKSEPQIVSAGNWLQKIAQLTEEDFIDEDGNSLAADGDIGDYNHDMRAMEHILGMSLDNMEELPSLSPEDLSQEQLNQIEANFPGFMENVWTGKLLPKEFAVINMGWIRVIDSNFEVQNVDEGALGRIVDYIYENTVGSPNLTFYINERSTQNLVSMQFLELSEAVQAGQGVMKYRMLVNRPEGLY